MTDILFQREKNDCTGFTKGFTWTGTTHGFTSSEVLSGEKIRVNSCY